jgi:Xaa-Pro dipeptidase
MDASRVVKSSYEISQIRHANAITTAAHTAVLGSLLTLTNESQIEALFTATCIASQAKSQAYGIIAGSGRNASTLHYVANNETLKGRQLVCLDAGCEWENYASDITRTFPISGKWTKEGSEIYGVVERMQEECIKMVRPGEDYRRIQMHAHKVLVEELLILGILCGGTFEEVLKSGVSTAFLPHGLGRESFEFIHCLLCWVYGELLTMDTDYMGLEDHDVGDGGALLVSSLTGIPKNAEPAEVKAAFHEMFNFPGINPSILLEGHVITIEPGM